MANIVPVNFPIYGEATKLEVTVLSFPTNATSTSTYWSLLTDSGSQCTQGNYSLTPEQFASWGIDNSVVDGYVAQAIGVVIIPPIIN